MINLEQKLNRALPHSHRFPVSHQTQFNSTDYDTSAEYIELAMQRINEAKNQ